MRLRAGVLTALLALAPAAARAGYDPLLNAEGTWKGQAGNGYGNYNVVAVVRRAGDSVRITFTASEPGGASYNALSDASPARDGRRAVVSLTGGKLKGFSFEVFARPTSGTELFVDSLLGSGTLAFRQDFYRADLDFSSLVTKVRASLTRVSAPAPKNAGPGKGGGGQKKKAPSLPPLQIAPR